MSLPLAVLIERLQADVPSKDSVPTAEQYERLVRAAVDNLGRRAGHERITTLSIVAGTASYDLPGDFMRLIRLESLAFSAGVMHTSAGLVPIPLEFAERVTVNGLTLILYPTPTYSTTRYLTYQAGWELDDADEYVDMTEEQAETLLLHAAAGALSLQANYYAQQAWQYAIGDERVSKERLSVELRAQADHRMAEYKARSASYNGPYGSRSEYNVDAYR
jgi:hypothetical protein